MPIWARSNGRSTPPWPRSAGRCGPNSCGVLEAALPAPTDCPCGGTLNADGRAARRLVTPAGEVDLTGKQSGMRWTVRAAKSIISLRCAEGSGRWDEVWNWLQPQTDAA